MEISNHSPLVSVIVPVYNVEQYLAKCVDSILNQTYRNLEIILVDDGSPDGCPAMCDAYAEQDQRIKVIHKTNGGLSDARNAGLDAATGEYITFIDSDDWYAANAIKTLVISTQNSCAFNCMNIIARRDEEPQVEANQRISKKNITTFDFLKGVHEQKYQCSSCGKLYPREFIGDNRFDFGILNEDYLFLTKLLLGKNYTIGIIDYDGYYYRLREGSISRSGLGKSSIDAVYNTVKMKNLAIEKCPALVPYIGAYAAFQARTALLLMNDKEYVKRKDFVKECVTVIKNNRCHLKNSFMKKKDILFCYACTLMPRIAVILARKFAPSRKLK